MNRQSFRFAPKSGLTILATALLATLLATAPAASQNLSITKIVDTNDPVPGGIGNITQLSGASNMGGGNVGIWVDSSSLGGPVLFTINAGAATIIATKATPIPDGTGTFSSFSAMAASGSLFALKGQSSSSSGGIYADTGGGLYTVADKNTPIPGGTGNFLGFDNWIATSGKGVAFYATPGIGRATGIYADFGAGLVKILDGNDTAPGTSNKFENFGFGFGLSGENTVIPCVVGVNYAIYAKFGSDFVLIADSTTPIPDGGGALFDDVLFTAAISGTNIAVHGDSRSGLASLSANFGSGLVSIADTDTPAPRGTGNFTSFEALAMDRNHPSENILFTAQDETGRSEIYGYLSGRLFKLVGLDDPLFGKTITNLWIGDATASEALSENTFVFSAELADGTTGVYLATIDPNFLTAVTPEEIVTSWTRSAEPSANQGHGTANWIADGDDLTIDRKASGAVISPNAKSGEFEFRANFWADGDDDLVGLTFGFQDIDNNYRLSWSGGKFPDNKLKGLAFVKEVDGKTTALFNLPSLKWMPDTTYELVVGRNAEGEIYFDVEQDGLGSLASESFDDSTFPSGKVGIFARNQRADFSNITLK